MDTAVPPLRIVYWTNWFGQKMFGGNSYMVGKECPVPSGYTVTDVGSSRIWCTITPNKTDPEGAAAMVFHSADYWQRIFPPRVENQPWILETMESPLTMEERMTEKGMEPFDYLASYHLKSTFLFSYFSPTIWDVVNRPLPADFMKSKTGRAPILWIARNCVTYSRRESYIRELQKYIDIDSYGTCLRTRKFPEDKTREELMAEYKFYLAIENANCEDYVTEKLFDSLTYAIVPIVDGPASYDDYLPSRRSAIRMDAYPDPRRLAEYIRYLDSNDTAYLEYLSYRRDAITLSAQERLTPSFISRWSNGVAHNLRSSWCSVCRGIIPWWGLRRNATQAHIDLGDKNGRFLVDNSCGRYKWEYAEYGPPYTPTWTPTIPDELDWPGKQQPNITHGSTGEPAIDLKDTNAATHTTYLANLWIAHFGLLVLLLLLLLSIADSRRLRRIVLFLRSPQTHSSSPA